LFADQRCTTPILLAPSADPCATSQSPSLVSYPIASVTSCAPAMVQAGIAVGVGYAATTFFTGAPRSCQALIMGPGIAYPVLSLLPPSRFAQVTIQID
jgi:hypothetical protein